MMAFDWLRGSSVIDIVISDKQFLSWDDSTTELIGRAANFKETLN